MLAELKQFNVEREGLEDLVAMHATGAVILAEFEAMDVDAPDWLEPKLRAVKRQIRAVVADRLEKRLADARLRLESLKTPVEKKAAVQAEIKRLEASLKEQ